MSGNATRSLRALLGTLCAVTLMGLVACATDDPEPAPTPSPTVSEELIVASYGSGVPETIAALYVANLNANGIPARSLSTTDLADALAAVRSGKADVLGAPAARLAAKSSATAASSPEASRSTPSSSPTPGESRSLSDELAKLESVAAAAELIVLPPAAAVDGVMFVMRRSRAAAEEVTNLSDLARVTATAPDVLAAPAGCAERYTCLEVLTDGYQIAISEVIQTPWDQVPTSLLQRRAEVGQLGTVATELTGLRILADDQSLLPPENIVPLLRESKEAAGGPIEQVQAELTTVDLREFARDLAAGANPDEIADSWVTLRLVG